MKKQIKAVLYALMAISLIVCMIIGIGRVGVEKSTNHVQIAIRYNDVLSIAGQTERTVEEVLKEFRDLGVTTIIARENTVTGPSASDLYSYKGQGEIVILDGYILKFYYPDTQDIKPEHSYIVTTNQEVAESIYNNYTIKDIAINMFEEDNSYFLEVGDYANALSTVGVGFNTKDLNLAASLGYSISPQIKNWTEPTEESLGYLLKELDSINNVGTIFFADMTVPGATEEIMANYIKNHQLGFIEFNSEKQKGFGALAKKASEGGKDFNVVRLHTLGDAQAKTYSIAEKMDRFELALNERGIRYFLFKSPNTVDVEEDLAYLHESITRFIEIAEKEGYIISAEPNNYNLPPISPIMAILAGIASISIFVLLLGEAGYVKTSYVLGVLGLIGYVGLLKLNTSLACKLMALFGAVIFPTYALINGIKEEPRNIKETIWAFLKICIISYGGVITIIGTLSRTSFGLGIDLFTGVKAAHIIPIALVLVILIYRKHQLDIGFYKSVLDKKISYGALLVIGIIGAALLVYTSRTGNTGSASALELQFRQLLTDVLGVRPRTKEFLIGYPILICLLFYGYKEMYLPFVIFAAIGPISLVNTYAHIHTPILISMLRSAYGIVIGLVIGLIAIWIIKLLGQVVKKWQIK